MFSQTISERKYLRGCIHRLDLLESGTNYLLFKTDAVIAAQRKVSSADPEAFNRKQPKKIGETVAGRLRVDILSDSALRVRYAEGDSVPENATPMVVGSLQRPAQCEIYIDTSENGRTATMTTANRRVVIGFDDCTITVSDLFGNRLCRMGGPEKNYFYVWDRVNTGICRTLGTARPFAVECFDLAPNECIYGLGEKFIRLNKVGQTIDLDMIDGHGTISHRSYKNIPFYVSSKGYGVYFNHSSRMTCFVGSLAACDVQVAADDDFLDYTVFTGSIKEILPDYTALTGKGVMPPAWSFGYWQSKCSYGSAEETLEIARKLRENEIPCDVIHLDTNWFKADWYCDLTFGKETFPDPKAYFEEMAAMGFKISLWQLPYIPEGSRLFNDLLAVDGFVKNSDGELTGGAPCFTRGFAGRIGVIDFTNPQAVAIYQDYLRRLFRLGAKAIKTDFGEAAPVDGVYHDGTPGRLMHNLYPLLYNKAAFEVTREETGDGIVWARSAWAGNQRYPVHWGGDNSPNFDNIIPQIEGGLSLGLSGFQFWSHDIGGFVADTNDQLLIRWIQVGVFASHARIHGVGTRELYKFKPGTIRICREYLRLRYRLLPYILGSARACVRDSLPMMRALVVEYQDDPNTHAISDQFLFGEHIMVAPIYAEFNQRRVYLPCGVWTDWHSGKRMRGNRWIDIEADIETLPLFVREGAVIPLGPVMNFVGEKPTDKLEVMVSLCEGEGETVLHVPIDNSIVPMRYTASNNTHKLVVGKCALEITTRVFGEGRLEVVRG